MQKFKRDDKIKLRPNAEHICRKKLKQIWHSCWRDAMGTVGKILGPERIVGGRKWNAFFPTPSGKFWIYEEMIMHVDEEECLTDAKEIYKLLDMLIEDA